MKTLNVLISSKKFTRFFGPASLYFLAALLTIRELNALLFVALVLCFALTWFYRTAGAIASSCIALLAVTVSGPSPTLFSPFSHVVFWTSYILSHFLMAYLLDLSEKEEMAYQEQTEKKLARNAEEITAIESEIKEKEKQIEQLHLAAKKKEEDLQSYQLLAKTVQAEAKKIKQQNAQLLQEALDFSRAHEKFELQSCEFAALQDVAKKRLDELNSLRVDRAENGTQKKEPPTEILEELLSKQEEAKKHYQEEVSGLNTLRHELEKLMHQKEPAPLFFREVESAIEERNLQLCNLRRQIFGLEAELIKIKTGNDEITPEGEYLKIADSECHRLEEENRILKQMIRTAFTQSE